MTGVVHLCMFTMLCNFINTFLSIMCGHFYFVLSVTVLRSFSMTVILLVLPILLVLFLPEEMTLNQGDAHQGDS